MKFRLSVAALALAGSLAMALPVRAQDTKTQEDKPLAVTPSARLAAARSVYLKNGGGSDTPFDVITMRFAEWPRFAVVDDPGKADLIVEITSPDDGKKKDKNKENGGFGMKAQGKPVGGGAQSDPDAPVPTRPDVLMTVRDARTKATLWSANEKTIATEKGMSKDEKFAAAGTRLMEKFRARVEPNIPPQ